MLTFIQTHAAGGDETAPYDVILDKPYTVGEFINEVLTTRSNEWGEFTVKNKKGWYVEIEYHYGEIETLDGHQVTKLPDDLCALLISEVKASGGWSNMDYDLIVD